MCIFPHPSPGTADASTATASPVTCWRSTKVYNDVFFHASLPPYRIVGDVSSLKIVYFISFSIFLTLFLTPFFLLLNGEYDCIKGSPRAETSQPCHSLPLATVSI